MNDGIEAFRLRLQKELGVSIGPKDQLLALWVSHKELLEQNAAQQQKLLSEFQAALGKSQTAWSEQAKGKRSGRRTSSIKTPKGEKRLMRLVYDLTANDSVQISPSFILPASLIMCWFQGGSHTNSTSASSTPGMVKILDLAS